MIKLNVRECTGCGACVNACEKNAVIMVRNERGFLYPQINHEICIQCGVCLKCCPLEFEEHNESNRIRNVYAMRSGDRELRWNSTSGGAFSELAKVILDSGGAVVGAAYREDWSVYHCMIYKEEDLKLIRRSKYQQSDIGDIYRQVKVELKKGRKVLFCGTPCQGAALKKFLKKEETNLYICDFICRGVGSPMVFKEYLKDLETQFKSDIISVWMKNKRLGWHSLTTEIKFDNGDEYLCKGMEDSYLRLFLLYNVGVRNCCYSCKFKGEKSVADITLGDFWGLEHSKMDDNLGTSVVMCRSKKGQKLLEKIGSDNEIKPMDISDVTRGNPCLYNSLEKTDSNADLFFDILRRKGYREAYESLEMEKTENKA